ncbi:MAG: hypothetical protein KatS3mg085_137 [Candidatus Dojkabacteria bacterium]|nr:MAG: hypothetical protein KatS3mg085_137 [Candidatus Dojkabacteria bacterium]
MDKKNNRVNLTKDPSPKFEIDLLEAQKKFFREFIERGFEDLFDEINPIQDYTQSSWELYFEDVEWGEPKLTFREAQVLGLTYDAPIHVNVKLVNKRTGEIKKQKIFLCDMPMMSDRATFMVNGNERVVVFQILRSEGLLFSESKASTPEKPIYSVKLMPARGKWYEFEMNKYGVMSVKLLEKRPKILLTTLLRALGYSSDAEIKKALDDADVGDFKFVDATLRKDPTKNTEEALIDIYRKLRPEDSVTFESAKEFLEDIFFNKRRFYLGRVGRYKLNRKLGRDEDFGPQDYLLKKRDIVDVVRALIKLNHGVIPPDDIDSLYNRRIRGINEIVSDKIRAGILLMEKNIRDKMSSYSVDEKVTPALFVNTRPVMAAINQFFGSSALLRYMEQQNILSELEAKRRITARGPRGLTKERATFSVRDLHLTHYSRVCAVTTPEGPSVGMVNQMGVFARVNDFGFLEAPYYKVVNVFKVGSDDIKKFKNRILRSDLEVKGKVIAKANEELTPEIVESAKKGGVTEIPLVPFVSDEVVYLDAEFELEHSICSAAVKKDKFGNILEQTTYVRNQNSFRKVSILDVDLIDVAPAQIGGLGLSLVPFIANDDLNRSFYTVRTLNQAVPLIRPQAPLVGTGFEEMAVRASGRTVFAEDDGVVKYADASKVIVEYGSGKNKREVHYEVEKYLRTNQDTCFSQVARVVTGDKFSKGDVLIDGPSTENGELALGANLETAFMVWDGYNYEDGIVISDRLVKEDVLTSVHIKEYIQEVRETKLGDELITRDIPGVGERALRHLGEDGVVRIGANVESGDILVGIITPKGETELTAEEKLLRAIFGEYARDVKDNSLRMPYGEKGIVIGVQVLDREKGAKLGAGVLKQVKVWVAKTHKIQVGDKLSGYHGDKGLIAKIVPQADMPHKADGTPIDIIVGPTSMVRRMNLGQLVETYAGSICKKLGIKAKVEPFSEYSLDPLIELAKKAGIEHSQKIDLYDGRTGQKFENKVTVGYKYFLKLEHLAEHKVHARSTGPYTLVTQQPLRGKAQRGGQRLGEMEVWALESHAVPSVLHEMLTIKSDDIVGRAAAYKAIISAQPFTPPNIPESFNVLDRELAGLAIKLDKIQAEVDTEIDDMAIEEIVDSIGNDN